MAPAAARPKLKQRIKSKVNEIKLSVEEFLLSSKMRLFTHAAGKRSTSTGEDSVRSRALGPDPAQVNAAYAAKRHAVTAECQLLSHQLWHHGVDVRDFQVEDDLKKAEEDAVA